MTREQAQNLVEMFEIGKLLSNTEEVESLKNANPKLLKACSALHEFAFSPESENPDTKRLNFLQSQLGSYSGKVICRDSVNGRGWRLHETEQAGAVDDVRKAIDNYFFEKVNI